jgi:outer membrane protein OmpA-like peptidoglycan-associated protein
VADSSTGDPARHSSTGHHSRHYSLALHSGRIEDPEPAPPPDDHETEERDDDGPGEFRQARVRRIEVPAMADFTTLLGAGVGLGGERTLFDVRISDWRLKHPAEANGRSYATMVGTILARLVPSTEAAVDDAGLLAAETTPGDTAETTPRDSVGRHTETVAPEPARIIAILKWSLAILFLLLGAATIAYACGPETAALWSAPVAGSLFARAVLRRAPIRTPALQWWLGAGALLFQIAVLYGPLVSASQLGCRGPIRAELLWLGSPILLVALHRSRLALYATTALWTGVLCTWCAELDGSCETAAGVTPTPPATITRPRTDPDGRWPVMPPAPSGASGATLPGGGGSTGTNPGGALAASGAGAGTGADGGDSASSPSGASHAGFGPALRQLASMAGIDSVLPEGMGDPPPPTSEAAPSGPRPTGASPRNGGAPQPSGASGAETASRPARASSGADDSAFRSVPSTVGGNGGWVAPDHRRTPRRSVLISLEHANRTPTAFFDSKGRRRVYLPTDPIFEHASADVSSNGELQLTRLAALLNLHPEKKVALDVHTDAAGAPETQRRLSEQRAGALRTWLVERGHLDAGRLDAGGVGGVRPIVPPDGSYAEQQPNRRIEVRLVE